MCGVMTLIFRNRTKKSMGREGSSGAETGTFKTAKGISLEDPVRSIKNFDGRIRS